MNERPTTTLGRKNQRRRRKCESVGGRRNRRKVQNQRESKSCLLLHQPFFRYRTFWSKPDRLDFEWGNWDDDWWAADGATGGAGCWFRPDCGNFCLLRWWCLAFVDRQNGKRSGQSKGEQQKKATTPTIAADGNEMGKEDAQEAEKRLRRGWKENVCILNKWRPWLKGEQALMDQCKQ